MDTATGQRQRQHHLTENQEAMEVLMDITVGINSHLRSINIIDIPLSNSNNTLRLRLQLTKTNLLRCQVQPQR